MRKFKGAYAQDVSAFIPQLWANESIAILVENMVIGNLVHRDFSNIIASFGETVNTRKPGEFTSKRKDLADSVTVQDATATNVAVVLNQHAHTSFLIRDGEESKSFKDLVTEYLRPAMISQARFVDQVLSGQVYQFLPNQYGKLGALSSSNAVEYITGVRNVANVNKMYMDNRNMVHPPNVETLLLQNSVFHQAQLLGDDGTALREASLGRKFGIAHWMAQNASSVPAGNTTTTGAINNAAGYAAGTTSLTVDGLSAAITAGTYFTVAGDMTPQRVVSTTGGSTPTAIVCTPGLKYAVVDDAVIKLYNPGQVNNAAGYAAGHLKAITIDGFTVAPKVGQLVAFGASTATAVYSVVEATTTSILLDRPLDAALADDDRVNIGPAGEYSFLFHPNALSLVIRPLAQPKPGTGALSGVVSMNGFSMRVTITYDGNKQGHLVTLDMLFGVKTLDQKLGAVMFG
jgi:hypothetical protein